MASKTPKNKKTSHIIIVATGALVLVATYFWLYKHFGISLRCLWYDLTGWYCPGCGVTRMLWSLITGDFYQAFRFNPLLFSLLPFGAWILIDYIFCRVKGTKKPMLERLPSWIWIMLIVIALIFGVLRNFDQFNILAPTIMR